MKTMSSGKLLYMMLFSAIFGGVIALINPIKIIKNLWAMHKGKIVVIARGKGIATVDDVDNLVSMLSKIDQNVAFLSFFPPEEQFNFYKKIIMDNVVNNYIYQEYIKDKALDQKENFKNHLAQYLKIMKGNFYSTYLQEEIIKNLVITDAEAIDFFEFNKENLPEFLTHPFIKKLPGIEARAVKINDNEEIKEEHKKKLYTNDNIINIERVNGSMRGVSPILLSKLKNMNDGDIDEVILENGARYALYKIKEHNGEWLDGSNIVEQIKEVMKNKIMNEKLTEIYNEITAKYNIFVNDDILKEYIAKKTKDTHTEIDDIGAAMQELQATEYVNVGDDNAPVNDESVE